VDDHEDTMAEPGSSAVGTVAEPASTAVAAEPESTGVAAADSALGRLRDIDTAPLEDHVEIFDDVQRRLHEGLAELDDEQ
jgi:hypothetical protein